MFDETLLKDTKFLSFHKRLEELFSLMDKKYKEASDHYSFYCKGCEDNCCRSIFYHHTLLEYMYIRAGLETLDDQMKIEIKKKAVNAVRLMSESEKNGEPFRIMCPLNFKGLCILYDYRPMICRLHGIPHELHTYHKGIVKSPGCDAFIKKCKTKKYYRFDRTPFYTELAKLEKEVRVFSGIKKKVKMTVARILI